MKQIILGTAGHIDHGKTSFIKALTGTDTDRLKEEKQRGITIELGFASIDLPNDQHIGIVDVPGHERFVKNMVAGATGIDIVAMVIAADEGVMPQTREHMEICSLLGIQHGIVVLSKIDLVDEDWIELVTDDIKMFIKGTFLEDAEIIKISSTKGEGIEAFKNSIESLIKKIPKRSSSNLFRLLVDRVFTMKGFGTVITGTLISGKVKIGDSIMIYPSRITSKVRGIQVHNKQVEEAVTGMRTAINFQGLDKSSVERGNVISTPNDLEPNYLIDAYILYLKTNKKPIKNRTRVRVHAGTSEILGNMILLDRDELLPGDNAIMQLRLDTPVSCVKDDKIVIRSYSPLRTIAGGKVLNPVPNKHKRFRYNIIHGLNNIVEDKIEESILFHLAQAGYSGVSFNKLKLMINMNDKKLNTILKSHLTQQLIILIDKEKRIYINDKTFNNLNILTTKYLSEFHEKNPLKEYMSKEELKSKLPNILTTKLFNIMLAHLVKNKKIYQKENSIRLFNHVVALKTDQKKVREKMLSEYIRAKLTPPYLKSFCEKNNFNLDQTKDVLYVLVDEGELIKIKDDLYFHKNPIAELEDKLKNFLNENKAMTTSDFKEMTGVSRKYLIPLIEYFDFKQVTIRVGDVRKLRKRYQI